MQDLSSKYIVRPFAGDVYIEDKKTKEYTVVHQSCLNTFLGSVLSKNVMGVRADLSTLVETKEASKDASFTAEEICSPCYEAK